MESEGLARMRDAARLAADKRVHVPAKRAARVAEIEACVVQRLRAEDTRRPRKDGTVSMPIGECIRLRDDARMVNDALVAACENELRGERALNNGIPHAVHISE
jgi:hypothetical protein